MFTASIKQAIKPRQKRAWEDKQKHLRKSCDENKICVKIGPVEKLI